MLNKSQIKNPETLISQHFKVLLVGALNQNRTGDLILTDFKASCVLFLLLQSLSNMLLTF